MKPLQIALLVVAGALGGAVVMKVWQRPQPAPAPAPVEHAVAQVETPAPARRLRQCRSSLLPCSRRPPPLLRRRTESHPPSSPSESLRCGYAGRVW